MVISLENKTRRFLLKCKYRNEISGKKKKESIKSTIFLLVSMCVCVCC